jgi:hypothetical protein
MPDGHVGNVADGDPLETPDDTSFRLSPGVNEYGDVVPAAVSDGSNKGERTIGGSWKVVAAIVLQNHAAGTDKTDNRAANGM